ncbi:hypothetical protein BXZ70DRAFT_1010166, partial [Cristinia sonorae]
HTHPPLDHRPPPRRRRRALASNDAITDNDDDHGGGGEGGRSQRDGNGHRPHRRVTLVGVLQAPALASKTEHGANDLNRGRFRPAAWSWTPTRPHRTAATPSKSPPSHTRPRVGQTTSNEVVSDPPRGPGRQHDPEGRPRPPPSPRTRVQDRVRGKRPQTRSFPTHHEDLDANTTPGDGRYPLQAPELASKTECGANDLKRGRFRPAAWSWTPTPPHRTAATPSKSPPSHTRPRVGQTPQTRSFPPAARTWTPTPPHRTAATPSKSHPRIQDRGWGKRPQTRSFPTRRADLDANTTPPDGRDPLQVPALASKTECGANDLKRGRFRPPRDLDANTTPGTAATPSKPRTRVQDRVRGKRPQTRSFPARRADLDANTTPPDGRDPLQVPTLAYKTAGGANDLKRGRFRPAARTWTPTPPHRTAATPSMSPHSPPCPCGGSETTSFEVVSPALGLGCSHRPL